MITKKYTVIMNTQIHTYRTSTDTYFYFGFGTVTIFLGLLFIFTPLLLPLVLFIFGALLLITGIASLIEGFLIKYRDLNNKGGE